MRDYVDTGKAEEHGLPQRDCSDKVKVVCDKAACKFGVSWGSSSEDLPSTGA